VITHAVDIVNNFFCICLSILHTDKCSKKLVFLDEFYKLYHASILTVTWTVSEGNSSFQLHVRKVWRRKKAKLHSPN